MYFKIFIWYCTILGYYDKLAYLVNPVNYENNSASLEGLLVIQTYEPFTFGKQDKILILDLWYNKGNDRDENTVRQYIFI